MDKEWLILCLMNVTFSSTGSIRDGEERKKEEKKKKKKLKTTNEQIVTWLEKEII